VSAVNIYSTTLFDKIGISNLTGSLIIGGSNLLGASLSVLVNRVCQFGYRPGFIAVMFIMATLLAITAVLEQYHPNYDIPLVISISLFLISYQIIMGGNFWPYISSVILTGSGFSLVSYTLWATTLLLSLTTTTLFNTITVEGTFYLFSGFSFLGAFTFICFFKESKNVT
jgi:hypothetical protein